MMIEKYRTALNAGSVSGLLLIVAFIVVYISGYNPIGSASAMYYWIPLPILIRSIRQLKENEFEGEMPFSAGLKQGLVITFVYSSMFAMLMYLFCTVTEPVFIDQMASQIAEKLEADKLNQTNEELYEQYDKIINVMLNNVLGLIAFSELISKFIFGAIVTLIASFVFRKPKKRD
ncbi:MAG: DUF4199 domain-containing protein [Flavobacteriales bacterium]|nr:DUF4199 domain-containing protein [Flavobacteriales bacterium]